MTSDPFDRWIRSLHAARDRRHLIRLALGILGACGLVTMSEPEVSAARRRQRRERRADLAAEKKKKKKCSAGLTTCKVKQGKKKKTLCVDAQADPANCGGCGIVCPSGQSCQRGACTGTPSPPATVCDAASCPNGCCDGTSCHAGNTTQACGSGGAACHLCAEGEICRGGTCIACALTVQPDDDLQQAINIAPKGGTVCLGAGTYPVSTALVIRSDVGLRGESASTTILRSDGSDRIITADWDDHENPIKVRIRNLTLTGGGLQFPGPFLPGGAIFAELAILELDACVLDENLAKGGYGGAIDCRGGSADKPTLTMRDCVFTNNAASVDEEEQFFGGLGGAVNIHSVALVTIERCIFEKNYAEAAGGGIFLLDNSHHHPRDEEKTATLVMRDCQIRDNDSATGAGLHAVRGKIDASQCTFTGNSAIDGEGGAVRIATNDQWDTTNVFRDCDFQANYADIGAGIFFETGGFFPDNIPSLLLADCTIAENQATSAGGGIYVPDEEAANHLTLENTSVTNNGPNNCAGATIAGCSND